MLRCYMKGKMMALKLIPLQDERYVDSYLYRMAIKIRLRIYPLSPLCFIAILKGGIYTTYSILRSFPGKGYDIVIGHLGLSSYSDGTESNGKVMITSPLDLAKHDVKNRHVWIIDDIADSGLTLCRARNILETEFEPASIHTAVLVDKKKNRIKSGIIDAPDVVGYTYEGDKFLVGCGLGYGEKYRELLSLYELEVDDEKT